jgi:hypothetical protein
MSVSWDTFERYRQKGLDARRAGQWDSARVYLLEAAGEVSGTTTPPQLQWQGSGASRTSSINGGTARKAVVP